MKKYKIYCYTNIKNNKKYIGQTYRILEQRAGINGREYTKKQSLFASVIKHYGWNSFQVKILKDNLTLEEANYWEEYYKSAGKLHWHFYIDKEIKGGIIYDTENNF